MRAYLLAFILALLSAAPSFADTPRVVASIKPIHSLVTSIMGNTGEPTLLVSGGASPHTFSLKPSHASALSAADLVFWIGPDLEGFLTNPMANLVQDGASVPLMSGEGVALLEAREGGVWGEHLHHEDHAEGEEEKVEHAFDPHIWLDMGNTIALTKIIESSLSTTYPSLASTFSENADRLRSDLTALDLELEHQLTPFTAKPYFVFHDAYQYFESRYNLTPLGAVTANPGVRPGARRMVELKEAGQGPMCVFAEPQFEPRILHVLMEDEGTKLGYLDPLGSSIPEGPDHFAATLKALTTSISDCLAAEANAQ
jgi:zinc transport system substrate-binding protein